MHSCNIIKESLWQIGIFSCNPWLVTLQAPEIKLSTTIYRAEIGASCHLDTHKKLITMAGLFSLSTQRVVCIIKAI